MPIHQEVQMEAVRPKSSLRFSNGKCVEVTEQQGACVGVRNSRYALADHGSSHARLKSHRLWIRDRITPNVSLWQRADASAAKKHGPAAEAREHPDE